jgi:hypothetical protein
VQVHFTHPLKFSTLASIPAAAHQEGSGSFALHSSAKSHEQRIGQSSGARSPLIKVNIRLGTDRLTAFVIYPPQGVAWPVFVYVLFKASR